MFGIKKTCSMLEIGVWYLLVLSMHCLADTATR
jgi:hypothetical protein